MTPSRVHGQYALYDALQALGSGAAASVHLGVQRGREPSPVAIKRLHAGQARQPAAVARLLDEVRLTRHIVHPNVVRTIDFVSDGEEMLAVMEYVHGEPLSRLLGDVEEAGAAIPASIALRIACDVLLGLEAAHDARDGEGKPLLLVHRDVTPENILVGADGVSRLMDFGVAKAQGRLHATHDGGIRGKLAYLAPEQVGGEVSARTDLYAVGLVTWEMLVGERAIEGENEAELLVKALEPNIPRARERRADVSPALDDAIARALAKEPDDRYEDAATQAAAFEHAAGGVATAAEVSEWVRRFGGSRLARRAENVHAMMAADTHLHQGPPSGSGQYSQNIAVYTSAPYVPVHDGDEDPTTALRSSGEREILSGETDADGERGHIFGLALMVLVAACVLGLGLLWRHFQAAGDAVDSRVPDFTEPVAPLPAASEPAPHAVAASPSPSPSPTMPSVSPASLPAAPPSAEHPRAPGARPRSGKSTASCDPPWTLDANGIRRYDPACVK